jgi:hypothetical protein
LKLEILCVCVFEKSERGVKYEHFKSKLITCAKHLANKKHTVFVVDYIRLNGVVMIRFEEEEEEIELHAFMQLKSQRSL